METISARMFKRKLSLGEYDRERYDVEGHLNLAELVSNGQFRPIFGCIFHDLDLVDHLENKNTKKDVTQAIMFERCVFMKPLLLRGVWFEKPLVFKECRFNGYVDFARAHLSGVSFHDCAFDEKVYFIDTCFAPWKESLSEHIGYDADFSEVTFKDGADFERSVFRGKTTFLKAVFYEATTFTDIIFCKGPMGAEPDVGKDILVFASAQIFGFVGFRKGANKKQEQAGLENGQGGASDKTCKCTLPSGESLRVFEYESHKGLMADFQNIYVQSSRGLHFHSANLEKCKLVGTNLDACYFNNVWWSKVRAHFPTTPIPLSVRPTTLSGIVRIVAVFASKLLKAIWLPVAKWCRDHLSCWFGNAEVGEGREHFGIYDHELFITRLLAVFGLREYFSRVPKGRGYRTDREIREYISKHFSISRDRGIIESSLPERWKLTPYDLLNRLEESKSPETLTKISKAYRDLKVAYEQDKDYIYASDFHFNEKELRRINPEVPWPTKVQLNLFWLINGYGERALRPVGWFLLFFVVGTLVYHGKNEGIAHPQPVAFSVSDVHATVRMPDKAIEGMPNPDSTLFPVAPFRSPSFVILESARGEAKKDKGASGGSSGSAGIRLVEAAGFSAATMAFLRPDFLELSEGLSWARVMSWFQTIVGPALFGMFALAIRNKLKR